MRNFRIETGYFINEEILLVISYYLIESLELELTPLF